MSNRNDELRTCPKCHTILNDDDRFCPDCNTDLTRVMPKVVASSAATDETISSTARMASAGISSRVRPSQAPAAEETSTISARNVIAMPKGRHSRIFRQETTAEHDEPMVSEQMKEEFLNVKTDDHQDLSIDESCGYDSAETVDDPPETPQDEVFATTDENPTNFWVYAVIAGFAGLILGALLYVMI